MVSELPCSYAAAVTMDRNAAGGNSAGSAAGAATPVSQIQANQNPVYRVDELDDPLYLHATENPNTILVSPPLTESNYAAWSRSMKIALGVKNKFAFVAGTIPCPAQSDARYGTWKRCNDIVCAWILRSLSPSIAESVLYFEVAEEIWNALKKTYSQADPHNIAEIQNEIYRSVQGNLSINEYFTRCNALWEQLKTVRPLPVCECTPRCNCTLLSKVLKDREDDQVIRFLDGLNDEYETIKSGALVMDPLPSMEKALNMALKLERKLNGSSGYKTSEIGQSNAIQNQTGEDQNIVAMASSNNKKKFNAYGGKNVTKCTYCGMNGHTIDKCFKKQGYPPGWIPGYKTKYKQNQSNQDSQHSFSPSVNQVADVGLPADQFQKLVSLLQNQNQGSQANQASTNAAITMSKTGMRQEIISSSADTEEGRGYMG
ncbi:PREDICTED: uncharacterized protein LOC109159512 isoform X2 [Ipomoea nil]|uniref:uncharacterized protein LOC109159512 isoform X2 n=1 Tax=Ipomoea nil TaxID=35883 RepID=UPI0009019D2E|nr:PREDICTED: uncharacterized protein LOC109159512 isoform X2 [Ipomoea nil]